MKNKFKYKVGDRVIITYTRDKNINGKKAKINSCHTNDVGNLYVLQIIGEDTGVCYAFIEDWLKPSDDIKVGDHDVVFNKDGSIQVGCTKVDYAIIKKIYEKATDFSTPF